MNKAKLNGQIIYASEIVKNYYLEKEIKKFSRAGKLMCPDCYCDSPVLKYCHGPKMKDRVYFAHRNSNNCAYGDYDKRNNDIVNNVKDKLAEHLRNNGVSVETDVKIFTGHYTHLAIYENDTTVAIELVRDSISPRKIDGLVSLYNDSNISVIFIVIGSDNQLQAEFEANFIRRYSLNESKDNSLLIISASGEEIYQYRYDTFNYVYRGCNYLLSEQLYRENSNFDSLVFENDSLTIAGFEERYNDWFNEKQKKFEEIKKPKPKANVCKVDSESTIPPSAFYPQKRLLDFQKKEQSTKKKADRDSIKSIEELKFIERTPKRNHKPEIEWSKKLFMEKINGVCYCGSRPSFQLLMCKFIYCTDAERKIIDELFKEFKEEQRPDYLYILETALKRSKE